MLRIHPATSSLQDSRPVSTRRVLKAPPCVDITTLLYTSRVRAGRPDCIGRTNQPCTPVHAQTHCASSLRLRLCEGGSNTLRSLVHRLSAHALGTSTPTTPRTMYRVPPSLPPAPRHVCQDVEEERAEPRPCHAVQNLDGLVYAMIPSC